MIPDFASKALIGSGDMNTISATSKFLTDTDFVATLSSLVLTHWGSPSGVEIDFPADLVTDLVARGHLRATASDAATDPSPDQGRGNHRAC
jgi:hypothetical protein